MLGVLAQYIFYPYHSKSAYLIVLVPILILIGSGVSAYIDSGLFYVSDYPEALAVVFIFLTISLFFVVNRIIAHHGNKEAQ